MQEDLEICGYLTAILLTFTKKDACGNKMSPTCAIKILVSSQNVRYIYSSVVGEVQSSCLRYSTF